MAYYKYLVLLHVLGATVWVGGHLVLALGFLPRALKNKDLSIIRNFEEHYERVGMPALLIQVITGFWLAYIYYPDLSDWISFQNHHATLTTIKLILLTLTLVVAIHARFFIIPKLSEENLSAMAMHIVIITILAVLFVVTGLSFRLAII
jgi:putative copper export protein